MQELGFSAPRDVCVALGLTTNPCPHFTDKKNDSQRRAKFSQDQQWPQHNASQTVALPCPTFSHMYPKRSASKGATQREASGSCLNQGQRVGRAGFSGWPCHLPVQKPLKVSGPQLPHLHGKGTGLEPWASPLPQSVRTGQRELVGKNTG